MDGWYYKVFGIEFGPVKLDKLIELAKTNALSREDYVRFGNTGAWRKVGSIGQLMTHLPFESTQKVVGSSSYQSAVTQQVATNSVPSPHTMTNPQNQQSLAVAPLQESERRWWCKIQDREYGPVELPKLIEWAATGRLLRDDQIRFGQDPYLLAGDLPGLFPEPPATLTNGDAIPAAPIQKAS